MPNTRTSDEAAATLPLDGTELVRIVQSGGNAKATTQSLSDFVYSLGYAKSIAYYGAVPNVDCSALVASLLAAGLPIIIPAVLSGLPWVMGDVTVPAGGVILGQSGQNYSTLLGKMRVQAKGGSTAVFKVGKNVRLAGFCIDGNGTGAHGVIADTVAGQGYLDLDGMDIRGCANGIGDSHYIRTVKAQGCTFYGNVNGIYNPIDSIFTGNFISANTTAGAYCGNGANANIFTGNKVEWNQQYGYHLQDCADITITGGVFDRNYYEAVLIDNTTSYVNISGVALKRNGRDNTGTNWAHIRVIGTANHITISGNTTKVGQDDGGTGTITPQYCIDIGSATVDSVTIVGNDLTGCTTAAGGLRVGASATNLLARGNLGVEDIDPIQTIVSAAGTTVLDGTVSTVIVTGTTTQTLTLPAARTGRKIRVINRSTGTATVNRAGTDTINGGTTGLAVTTAQIGDLIVNANTDWVGKAL